MLDEILWQQNKHLAEACLHHPFVRGLADGTLYPEAFLMLRSSGRLLPQRVRSGLCARRRPQPGGDAHLAL